MNKIENLLHWYNTTVSFMTHKNLGLIPLDSIAFIGQTGQIYTQGRLLGVSTEEFCKLKEAVAEIQQLFNSEDGSNALERMLEVIQFFEGYLTDKTFKEIVEELQTAINNKVDKVDGKGLSTNDFTNEFKDKLEDLNPLTKEELTEILL